MILLFLWSKTDDTTHCHFIYFSLWLFFVPPLPSWPALPFLQHKMTGYTCVCVCVCNVSPKVNMGILACENLWFCVSVRVCLLMCPIIPRQHVCVVWLHHLSPCLGTWHWFSCALTSCRSWFSVSFGKTHTPSLQSPASIPPFLSPSSIHPDHSPPHLLIIRMAAVR